MNKTRVMTVALAAALVSGGPMATVSYAASAEPIVEVGQTCQGSYPSFSVYLTRTEPGASNGFSLAVNDASGNYVTSRDWINDPDVDRNGDSGFGGSSFKVGGTLSVQPYAGTERSVKILPCSQATGEVKAVPAPGGSTPNPIPTPDPTPTPKPTPQPNPVPKPSLDYSIDFQRAGYQLRKGGGYNNTFVIRYTVSGQDARQLILQVGAKRYFSSKKPSAKGSYTVTFTGKLKAGTNVSVRFPGGPTIDRFVVPAFPKKAR